MENMPKAVKEEVLESIATKAGVEKELAEQALASSKIEGPVSLKSIKDPKMFAAIEFFQALPDTEGRWGEVFESLKKDELTPKAYEFLQKFVAGEAGPKVTYHFDEIKGGSYETPQMKEFREAKTEFEGKFANKLAVWKSKGFEVENMNALVKAYMADKGLDLVTTKDKKVAWGTPAAGFVAKL